MPLPPSSSSRPRSALDEAVFRLSRSSASSPSAEPDDEASMDRYVAELLLQEAREPSSSTSSSPARRKPSNTRFLQSMLQSVHGHNERLARASPQAMPSQGSPSRHGERRRRSREREESAGKMRAWCDGEEEEEVETGRRSKEASRRSGKRDKSDEYGDEKEPRRGERGRSEERRRANRKHDDEKRSRRHGKERENRDDRRDRRRSASSSPRRRRSRSRSSSPPRAKNRRERRRLEREARQEPDSKMDKYFASTYDPQLDVSSEVRTDELDLVEDDGWSRMLEVMQERRERKEERKAEKARRELEKKEPRQQQDQPRAGSKTVMETQYAKQGSTREWDLGKEQQD